jgi:diguanylate cyclase (GGDEF)-like protein
MRARTRFLILGLNLAVLGVSGVLGWAIYSHSRSALEATTPLLQNHLPIIRRAAELQSAVVDGERVFQEVIRSGDPARFRAQIELRERKIEDAFSSLLEVPGNEGHVASVRQSMERINGIARKIEAGLSDPETEPRILRALATSMNTEMRMIGSDLGLVMRVVEEGLYEELRRSARSVEMAIGAALGFSGALLIVALLIGYFVTIFVADVERHRRVALFAEKNPNPVMRLSLAGEVGYANPGAVSMLRKLKGDSESLHLLLPADLKERIAHMRNSATEFERWEYELEGRTLNCSIQYLSTYRMFHAYVFDVSERKRAEQRLVFQASHDAVTGLPNRRRFQEMIEAALSGSEDGNRCAVLLLNLDRFGLVNSGFGHLTGDRLLQSIAERMQRVVEQCRGENCVRGTLFRFEADTFCVLIDGMGSAREAAAFAQRICASMAEPFYTAGHEFFATASIGISVAPEDGANAVGLMKKADIAMQAVKRRGGNGHQAYCTELDARVEERLAIENGLRRALELKELTLHFQPQVEIRTGRMIGTEVLLRWNNAALGAISPAAFIPIAEHTGLIIPIGEWVLRTACCQRQTWAQRGLAAGVIAVNVSARQFHHRDFISTVTEALAQSGLDPRLLELEITEGVAMENVELTVAMLQALKQMGVRLSIDDFGTGYSSLAYLKRFSIDKLKVDQSFVRNMTHDANDAAITRAVIDLGHSLRLKVIAEGVETQEHLNLLTACGCDEIQGYLFSKPLPAADMTALLAEGRSLQAGFDEARAALREPLAA